MQRRGELYRAAFQLVKAARWDGLLVSRERWYRAVEGRREAQQQLNARAQPSSVAAIARLTGCWEPWRDGAEAHWRCPAVYCTQRRRRACAGLGLRCIWQR